MYEHVPDVVLLSAVSTQGLEEDPVAAGEQARAAQLPARGEHDAAQVSTLHKQEQ